MIPRTQHVVVLEDSDEDFATLKMATAGWARPVKFTRFKTLNSALEAVDEETFEPPSLFLLDLTVPGGSGLDFLRALKAHARFCTTPAIVLSTTENPTEIRSCYAHHANAFHTKELETSRMIALVVSIFQYWLGRVRLVDPGRKVLRG